MRDRLDVLARWLQREDDELLYAPDDERRAAARQPFVTDTLQAHTRVLWDLIQDLRRAGQQPCQVFVSPSRYDVLRQHALAAPYPQGVQIPRPPRGVQLRWLGVPVVATSAFTGARWRLHWSADGQVQTTQMPADVPHWRHVVPAGLPWRGGVPEPHRRTCETAFPEPVCTCGAYVLVWQGPA
jgi:hypothetical protein